MIIKKMYIEKFGGITDKTYDFCTDIDITVNQNEYGKTTVAEFIKAMLYGINNGARNIRGNARKRYMPWGKTQMSGELTVSVKNRTYIIKRIFGTKKSEDQINVSDSITGERISKFCTDSPCFAMTGISIDVFEKALFINSLSLDLKGDKGEIMDRLVSLTQGGDEVYSYKHASELIIQAMREIDGNRANSKLKILREKLQNLYLIKREQEQNNNEINQLSEELVKLKAKEMELTDAKNTKILSAKNIIVTAFLAVISILLYFTIPFLTFFSVAGLAFYLFILAKKNIARNTEINELLKITKEIGVCESKLSEKRAKDYDFNENSIKDCLEKITVYDEKSKKLSLAKQCLDEAFGQIQQGFGPKLNLYVSEILSVITNNKYDGVKVDKNYEMTVHCKTTGWQSAQYLSEGTYDQIYFSLKMAIVKMLFSDMPIILDDAFAKYDDARKKRAMEYLSNIDNQVIVFSCR